MERIAAALRGRNLRRIAVPAAATLVAFLAVLALARMATAPRMELLFGGLEAAAAGEVVASLEARGIPHEVSGGAILVPADERDALRLQLAGEGLPRSDGVGYEVLDGLSGFGTTGQMFDAAFLRAREGELTRTILAGPGLKSARVHIASADRSPFSRDRQATASVTLQMQAGSVGAGLARAVQSLVAGAVPGLPRDGVTVIDAGTGRIVSDDPAARERTARSDRVAEMRAAVENILAARVGAGRYVVELALETRDDREVITERVLDPESRVVLSTDNEERSNAERGLGGGVTVASNLPDGAAAGGESESNGSETRERVNYDFSETERRVERAPGAVERITVAVMVDGLREPQADGTLSWAPRPDAELDVLRELVVSAVGFREERGDVVTVRSMEFDLPPEPGVAPGLTLPWITGSQTVQLGVAALLALVALGALAFLVRPAILGLLAPPRAPGGVPAMVGGPAGDAAAAPVDPLAALPSDLGDPAGDPPALPDLGDLSNLDALPDLASGGMGRAPTEVADDPVQRLRDLIAERREETVEVLRSWIEQAPEETR